MLPLLPLPCPKCGSEGPKYNKKRSLRNGIAMVGRCRVCSKEYSRRFRAIRRLKDPDWAEDQRTKLLNWQKENPKKRKEGRLRRKAIDNDRLPPAEWVRMKQGWSSRCAYCGEYEENFPKDRSDAEAYLHQDHVTPRSSGGEATWDNILPACFTCNITKSDMPVWEFIG